ncbi:LLM class flavin-dependent oxidoreductase [Mycobacteroides abscessus subsp. bolletii]|uniref:LLM class flavin-dependent oxidoreductase n=1 Tax=Mycobacteroides abscessus TaxID=36809 RepID=UPI0019D1AC8A|nr:LLM class flavin-dependent oxidoreductase [Mycobacteroides abscessus]MBN7300803.1 LLM class flavin-dependent oxidoreductase [Mycobacteroides abscessus subsp. bolletii]
MADRGRPLQFGLFLSPRVDMLVNTHLLADIADVEGLDLVGIQDHPYQSRFLDTWPLLTSILCRTGRVRVLPDVGNLPLRPPAVLAKMAATMDLLSHGRFEMALGTGTFWQDIAAMGGEALNPKEAAGALKEAVKVMRLMWSQSETVQFDGRHYQLDGAHPGPAPAHDIQIWLGVGGPRLLEYLGAHADGWIPSNGYYLPEQLPSMQERIDGAALSAGRDPADIVRAYNVIGEISDTAFGAFHGPVSQWVDELTCLALDTGIDTFLFGTPTDDREQAHKFATKVVPAVRAAVQEHRILRNGTSKTIKPQTGRDAR